jgi:hypothetical protein
MRLWWGLVKSAFGGSLESGGRFCVGAFGRNLASVTVTMLSYLLYKEILYILYFQCNLQR